MTTPDHTLDAVERVRRACLDGDGVDPFDEAAALHLKHHGLARTRAWTEPDGFALVIAGELVLAVAPTARREGLGADLATAAAPFADRAWSHGGHPGAARLAAQHGWTRTRDLWVMRRPIAPETGAPGSAPAGITIRGYRESDRDALLTVNAGAFSHHPEQGSMDARDLADRMAEPWFDPAGLLVAIDTGAGPDAGAASRRTDDGVMLAFHWTKRHSTDVGEVYVVAVDPAEHGRGLGTLMTAAGLEHLAAGGTRDVLLYVESDNVAAVRVYRDKLGFTHAPRDTHVQYTAPAAALA
ncbi:mycothiol synthase [Nocardioides sp. R-C-SC26]|uniref:mycothiol synthase n=1 Tax=Nocardioides sp. R-C-SC26 TaxID=2870414 RepID=UPI001E2EF14C|nr:mycothiol synthase [Nocardioides sp. R-C-SC26]